MVGAGQSCTARGDFRPACPLRPRTTSLWKAVRSIDCLWKYIDWVFDEYGVCNTRFTIGAESEDVFGHSRTLPAGTIEYATSRTRTGRQGP